MGFVIVIMVVVIMLPHHQTTTVLRPFSRTTRESRCQKRTSGRYVAADFMLKSYFIAQLTNN